MVRQITDIAFALQPYSKCNQSQLYFILLECFNLYHLTGIISIQSKKICTNSLFWITNAANIVLNSSFVEIHSPSSWLSNTLFERLFLPEKVEKFQNQYMCVVSHKHEFLMVVITKHVTLPINIQHFLQLIILCMNRVWIGYVSFNSY